jgi:amino acid adenylation domain-containing protein/non-ribosomal peptide synthase protein (TIGR01720 family)
VAPVHSQEQSLGGGREFSRKEGGQKQRVSRPYSAPETETEKALVTIWQELLNGQSIGVDDDFFELGGHSLKATRLVSRIHRALNREVDLAAVFSDRTIRCLASRIDQKSSAWEPIPKVAVSRTYPLSHAQRRMWALHQLESDSIAYNSTGFYWVDGSLDVNRFREAVFLIISKHEILRSVFQEVEWDVNMVVRNPDESQVEVVEFEREDSQESTAALQQFAARLIESSFRLDVGPLFVVKIVRGAEERFLVALHMHHIVSDGISLDLFQREVMACYDQALDGPLQQEQSVDSREIRYTDYAAWQEQWITGAAGRACRDFWTNKLKDLPPALPLPTDRSRLPVQTFRGDSIQFRLNEGCWSDIVRLSTGEGGTPFSAFVTLVKLLLFRHTHQPDIVVGTVTSGRDHPDLENVIGLIANTVALRSQVEGVSSFVEILGQVARVCQEAFSNQGYPFDLVLDSLGLERDLSRSALFDVMITYQGRESTASPASLSFEEWECDSPLSRFDLTFNALETETGLIVTAVFNVDLFDRRRIEQMGKRFVMLAESVRSAPKESLAQLEFLPADERAWLHEKFFPAKVPFRSNRTLPQLFDEVVSHYPMAPALKADSLLLSYRELANEAEHIANLVLTQEGKGRSGVVGVLMRSRSHAVVAMLGVLKAGCVYLPIDSSYPADRIEHLLQDSNACALITDFEPDAVSAWAVRLGVIFWGKEVPLDVEGHSDSSLSRAEPKATDPAYLIYTSGSTGMPKGVMVSHRGFVNMIFQQIETFDVKPGDRVVLFSSLSFDASLSEMFMSLLAGAVLCCPSRDVILDGVQFLDYLREEKIDVATLPPQFLRALSQPDLSSLKTVITAGEAAFSQDVQFYAKTGRLRYVNAYGPTECSVCATMYVVPKEWSGDHVPIGRPLDNLGIGLIDTDGRLAPVGHPGEICLRGVGLAEGYWNRPDLKAECFPARPELGTGTERVYFTGDIGVWTEEGDLLFVGRADEQLKIRGHRVEPGEIEKALSRYHGVSECCVIGDRSALGGIRLVAFYSGVATPSELGAVLRQQLPAYLVPSRFISMKALPVTSSGKVDRAALVVLEEPMAKPGPLGTTREEEILLKILGDVLGRHAFELTDSFFELGGDSIQAIEVIQHLAREGYQVEVRDLVLNPTVQELALVLRSVARPDGDKPPNRVTASEAIPLTPIQSWFFSVFGAERDHFNHSDMIFSEAHFDEQAVKAAVEEVWKDHDQLRAQFRPGEGVGRSTDSWLQVVPENAAAPIWRCSDLRGEEEWETHLLKQANELQTGLSLQEGPLLGVCLFQCTDGDRLLFVIHHLVIDGVSWRILLDDFLAAYRRIVGEGVKPQCGKGASFADWSMALQNLVSDGHFLGQRNYWEGVLNGEVDTLPLKAASAGRVRSVQAHFSLMLSHEDTALLSERVKRGSLLGDWILAGVGLALCRWSGANRFLVANESHGRHVLKEMPALDVARTVGWFTNVFPVRLEIDSSEPLEVNAVRLTTSRLAVPDFGLGYGVLRYLSQDSEKLVARASPQMSFNYLGRYGNTDLDGLRVGGDLDGEAVSPKARVIYDLEWNAIILNGELRVVLGVAEGALNPADVETIMDGLRETLLTVPKGAKDESGNESSGASKVT